MNLLSAAGSIRIFVLGIEGDKMYTIVPGKGIGPFEIGMTPSCIIQKMGLSAAGRNDNRHRMIDPNTVVYQTSDRQCLVYCDLRVGLVTTIALCGNSNEKTPSGIHIGMTLAMAQRTDDSVYLDEFSDLYTSSRDPGVFFELEDTEPFPNNDFSRLLIERIEVTDRQLTDAVGVAKYDASTLESIRRKFIKLNNNVA